MAIGFRASSNSGAANAYAATVSPTMPTGTLATDIVIANFAYGKTGASIGSWTPPSAWTAIANPVTVDGGSGDLSGLQLWWSLGSNTNLTWTAGANLQYLGWTLAAFTGVNPNTPIDATAAASSAVNATSVSANAVTVAADQSWEVIGHLNWDVLTTTATGFTVLSNYVSRLLYNTTAKSPGSTGAVTVNSSSSAAMLLAQPFALRPFVAPMTSQVLNQAVNRAGTY